MGGVNRRYNYGNRVDIATYKGSSNVYTCPSDGCIYASMATGNSYSVVRLGSPRLQPAERLLQNATHSMIYTIPVVKGMQIYFDETPWNISEVYFVPLEEY